MTVCIFMHIYVTLTYFILGTHTYSFKTDQNGQGGIEYDEIIIIPPPRIG